ncbi:MAG: PKD domain-containing protein [Bacteroidota bacterium]
MPALKLVLGVSLVLLLSDHSVGQGITETRWYFGNSPENLVFDLNGRDVITQTDQSTPFGMGGAVTLTDQLTGNLLFYSDGTQVFDVSHALVPNGIVLNGNPAINNPVATCPVPGSPGEFYLFTNSGNQGVAEIQYVLLDQNLQGNGSEPFPYGDISSTNPLATGLLSPSEGMVIIPQGDGETFYLLSQNATTFEINVTIINDNGLNLSSSTDFSAGDRPGFEISQFAFNRDSALLAVSPKTANRNIWLLSCNVDDRMIAFDSVLTGTGFNDGLDESIYDLEWSSDGSKLYFSRFGSTAVDGQLYQIDFSDSLGVAAPILENPVYRSLGLKRAIDDRIYHLYQTTAASPFNIGRINRPDSVLDSIQYIPLVLDQDFNARQFPEFTGGYSIQFDTIGFTFIDSCQTNITKFFPTADPVPNRLFWDFGDGGGSTSWIPNYTYADPGTYTVTMSAEVGGVFREVPLVVNILPNSLEVDLGNDTTICVDDILTLDAGGGSSFVWNTGEVTQSIAVDTTGTYWVEVTDASGCTGFDEIEVTEYGVTRQNRNQWYFGERAGIEFTGGPIAILDGNQQSADEGCATISGLNGELLFYTNGTTVWNRNHDIMVNGDSIGGDEASAQNTLIMPFNEDQTIFYLFTTEQVYGDSTYSLKYSIVDMKEDSARGKVIIKDVKLMDNSTERITGSGFDGTDIIVAHEFGNNTFRAFRTGFTGLSTPIFSQVGEVHDFMNELSATGYMKISPTDANLAVNIPGTDQVEIFDLEQGALSNPRVIDTGEDGLYGMEFSSGGAKLYLTTLGPDSKLIQYDLDSLNGMDPETDIEASKFDGYPTGSDYGALQMGPDLTIYMARDNSGVVGTIGTPDADDLMIGFDQEGFDLQGRTSRLGLPNFSQETSTPLQEPSITITPGCVGLETSFTAVGRDPNNQIESYQWIFGDGTFANVRDTTHIYNLPGTYTVQMVLSNRCDTDTTLTQTITVNSLPERPLIPSDTALCDQPIRLFAWDEDRPEFSYIWSTGDTTRSILVSEPALIDVSILNTETGCASDTLEVFVGDARPDVDLGPDLQLCQGDSSVRLPSNVSAIRYEWRINGAVSGSNRTIDVTTTNSGTFVYTFEAQNSLGCIGRDTVRVTIIEAPDVSFTTSTTNACQDASGTLNVDFNNQGSFSYELRGPTPFGPANLDGVASAPPINNLLAGDYDLEVVNLVTGCTTIERVQIEDPPTFNLNATGPNACLGDGEISLSFESTPVNFDVSIRNEAGVNILSTQLTDMFTNPVVASLDTGTFFVTVQEIGGLGCSESDTVRIGLLNAQPDFTFDALQDFCGSPATVRIMNGSTPNVSYVWSTANGMIEANPTPETIEVSQDGTYTVTASAPGFCDRTEDIEVTISADPDVDVAIIGDPCDGFVQLQAVVANGSGSYLYEWSDGSQSEFNSVTVSDTYTVTVTDQVSNCSVLSDDIVVEIEQDFSVVLSLNPDCNNSGSVEITAVTNYFDPLISYEWTGPEGSLADLDSMITVSQEGLYTVEVTNETGNCIVSELINVSIQPITADQLILPEEATFCSLDTQMPFAELDAGIFNTYEWRLLGDTSILSTDQVYQTDAAGIYEVTVFNGSICTVQQVRLIQDCRPVIFAPNAFTPDDNGLNDEFFIFKNDFIDEFEILIYTRWGELIYTSQDQNFRWDGIFNGSLLPPETYAYIIKFTSSLNDSNEVFEQYGSVKLVR